MLGKRRETESIIGSVDSEATLKKKDFEECKYNTIMCPECHCSIDIFYPMKKVRTARCDGCGEIYTLI